jgi:hypothetical protein
LYLTLLVIIYGLWTFLRAVGLEGEARPIAGLFKCSWLNLGASLTESCRMRTGGLRVSMRFIGPEEGWVFALSRTPGPALEGIFAAGAPPAASLSEDGCKGAEVSGYSAT